MGGFPAMTGSADVACGDRDGAYLSNWIVDDAERSYQIHAVGQAAYPKEMKASARS